MSILAVRKMSKRFGGVTAVDRCSFDVREHTITSLIGPNGAGKTTLFNLINGMNTPDSGTILFDGIDITGLPVYTRAQKGMARTFQQVRLFRNLTIRENLQLAKPQATDDELHALLGKMNVHKSLSTVASDLSFGQQRLLEIARALLTDFTIILMDEPTAGVNPFVRKELKRILLDIRKNGKTVLLIEHDMDFVMDISDEVIVLNDGRVLRIGTPKQVVKDRKVLEAYLGEA